jgi:hypothetical protein
VNSNVEKIMRRFCLTLLVSTLWVMAFSFSALAQDAAQPSSPTAPNTTETMTAPNIPMDSGQSTMPADRVEAECRDWALQDGVPENELADYVKECVEDRAVQE